MDDVWTFGEPDKRGNWFFAQLEVHIKGNTWTRNAMRFQREDQRQGVIEKLNLWRESTALKMRAG